MSHPATHLNGAEFLKEENRGLFEPSPKFQNLAKVCDYSSKSNTAVAAAIPAFQDWREAAHQIKRYAIANLDKLLVQFESQMKSRGVEVLFAQDAAEANRMVLDIARQHNVKSVVKSKSMVTEEMELNDVLADEGIRAVETDLGEYIVQLAQQRPIHIVTPAMHFSAGEVGELFQQKLGEPYSAEHAAPDRHRPQAPAGRVPGGRHGHFGLQLRRGRFGHGGRRRERGQRRAFHRHAARSRRYRGHREGASADRLPATVPQPAGPLRHRPEADDVHAPDPRPGGGQEDVRDLSRQWPHEGLAGPARLAVAVLHPLRRLPERLPGLSPRGRLVLRLGLSGPDRFGAHAATDRHAQGGQAAFRLVALRRVRRGLPGEDRHSSSACASAASRGQRAVADELAPGAAHVAALGLGDGRAAALRPGHVGRPPGRTDGQVSPLASRQAGCMDPRPRVAPRAVAFLPQLVAKGGNDARVRRE